MERLFFWLLRHGCLALLLFSATHAFASVTSYHIAHPITWMHQLPVGETPGWRNNFWLNFEVNHANVWNHDLEMTNNNNGKNLKYSADFEQSAYILEVGGGLTSWLGFSLELPYTRRDGGFLDDFIDDFHTLIGSERFLRPENENYRSHFSIKTDDQEQLGQNSASGLSNMKTKWKLWLLKWDLGKANPCPCGLSLGYQTRFPLNERNDGLSSGGVDHTGAIYFGFPIGKTSAIWTTAAFTYAEKNKFLEEWPRRKWLQMYELSIDIGLIGGLGILLQGRVESPFMNKGHLAIIDSSPTPEEQAKNLISSGWNSLTLWRGTQAGGIRYQLQNGSRIHFLLIEDWWFGTPNQYDRKIYSTNAPDISAVLQVQLNF